MRGAKNRVAAAIEATSDNAAFSGHAHDFVVGIEGGCRVSDDDESLECFAWIFVSDSNRRSGKARTATFDLPRAVAALMKEEGLELGDATDRVFQASNSKQKGGSVGMLTNDIISRQLYYEHAVTLSLIPFMNRELYHG